MKTAIVDDVENASKNDEVKTDVIDNMCQKDVFEESIQQAKPILCSNEQVTIDKLISSACIDDAGLATISDTITNESTLSTNKDDITDNYTSATADTVDPESHTQQVVLHKNCVDVQLKIDSQVNTTNSNNENLEPVLRYFFHIPCIWLSIVVHGK